MSISFNPDENTAVTHVHADSILLPFRFLVPTPQARICRSRQYLVATWSLYFPTAEKDHELRVLFKVVTHTYLT